MKEKNPEKYKDDHKKYQSKYRSANLEVVQTRDKANSKAYRARQKQLLADERTPRAAGAYNPHGES